MIYLRFNYDKQLRGPILVLWLLLVTTGLLPWDTARAAPPAQMLTCAETYIMQADDRLSGIAAKYFGNPLAYPAIIVATNQQRVADASFTELTSPEGAGVGRKLCIPAETDVQTLTAVVQKLDSNTSVPTTEVYTLDNFIGEFLFSPEVDPQWIYTSPEPLPQYNVLPEHQTNYERYGYRSNYYWNDLFMKQYYGALIAFDAPPNELHLFHPTWETIFPKYRYPPNVTLPTQLTTNQFGWRGPQITLQKPDKTIRIACVGASTTVDGHQLSFSYPELLQHWLNLWSTHNGYDVRFEVINAGREGIGSSDIAAVARYELLPMDLDYVIYYEGSNQFDPRSMVTYPEDMVYGQPPPGMVPNLAEIQSADESWLDTLSQYSAVAARIRTLAEKAVLDGVEPPKPAQTFHLPDGLNEMNPDRAHLGDALALRVILGDLGRIKRDLDANKVTMVLATFDWFVYEGLVVDPARHRGLYIYLNRAYWPISYANMRRMADLQNRVFKQWAADNGVSVIDVAGLMPRHPDLYGDAIHNSNLGVRIRAWINFQAIVPLLKADIERQILPRPGLGLHTIHPMMTTSPYTKSYAALRAGE
jgi:hypothetical protein